MPKPITVLAGFSAEDMSWLREVVTRERDAEKPHWPEPPPAGFFERLGECQTIALSSAEQALLDKQREIDTLREGQR